MANPNPENNFTVTLSAIWWLGDFSYTGDAQSVTIPETGYYKFEAWGASGGTARSRATHPHQTGAYVSGKIYLVKDEVVYVYVGEHGHGGTEEEKWQRAYNGGGYFTGGSPQSGDFNQGSGGGATDFRLVSGDWNDSASLRSRIMVAGAGAGRVGVQGLSGRPAGGGLISDTVTLSYGEYYGTAIGATQTSGYLFGVGQDGFRASGGGGYYGGRKSSGTELNASGGSSYISGHTGCVAITSASDETPKTGCTTGTSDNSCSRHYSGKYFTDTKMIDGQGYNWTNTKGSLELMPNPSYGYHDENSGHAGNGHARITYLGASI